MSPPDVEKRLVRSAVIELVRQALDGQRGTVGATRELVRVAEGAKVESELVDVLRAALALVG